MSEADTQGAAAGTGNTAPVLTTVTVLVFLWALVAYLIRVYVKLSQSDGWKSDDWAITGSIVGALAQLIALCYAINRGYGSPWELMAPADHLAVEQSLYASQILYVVAVGAAKISASLFIAHVLARDTKNIIISSTLTGLCVSWTVASILAIGLRGDLLKPWELEIGSMEIFIRWVGIEASAIAIDLVAAAVVAYFIYDLQMKTSKKLVISSILNSRILLALPVAFRLYYLHPSVVPSSPRTAELIRQVIIGSNVMFSALTCLKPFLKPFDKVAFGSSHHSRPGLFGYVSNADDRTKRDYYELSRNNNGTNRSGGNGSGNRKSMVMHSQRSLGADDDEIPLTEAAHAPPKLRPGYVGNVADIRHGSLPDPTERAGHLPGRNISMTQTWDVRVT